MNDGFADMSNDSKGGYMLNPTDFEKIMMKESDTGSRGGDSQPAHEGGREGSVTDGSDGQGSGSSGGASGGSMGSGSSSGGSSGSSGSNSG